MNFSAFHQQQGEQGEEKGCLQQRENDHREEPVQGGQHNSK